MDWREFLLSSWELAVLAAPRPVSLTARTVDVAARAASLPAVVAVRAALPSASSTPVPPSKLPKPEGSAAAILSF